MNKNHLRYATETTYGVRPPIGAVSPRPPISCTPETAVSWGFICECGGQVAGEVYVPGNQDVVTIPGCPCDSCDKTYTVEVKRDSDE